VTLTRRRRRALLLVLLLLTLGLLLVPFGSRSLLERQLAAFFHRPVSVGQVRYQVFPFEATVENLRVEGPTPDAAPFLEARRLEIVPSLTTLFSSRLSLARVRIQGLTLRVNAYRQGGDDIPRMGGSGGKGGEVRIRRLVIEGGAFLLDHARVPLELDLPDFNGRLAARRGGVLAGSVSFGAGHLQFGTAPPLGVGTELDLALEGPVLTVESAHVRTAKSDLAYQGQLRLAKDPQGTFALKGPVDLEELDRHVMRTGFGIKGDAHFDGTLGVDGPRLHLKGRMSGTAGVFDGVPVPRYAAAEVEKNESGVHIRGLDITTLGGTGVLDVDVPPNNGVARLDADVHAVDAEGLVRSIFHWGSAGLGSTATGTISIRWPRGKIRRLDGRIALDLAAHADGRTPLEGRFEWSAKDGMQRVEKADLRTPATWARLDGTIQPDDRTSLSLDANSSDLAATDDLLTRLRRALGLRDARPFEIAGRGAFRGRWLGTLGVPVFEGRFSGQDVGYLGVVWGQAEWAGVADPSVVRSHSLVLRRPGGELWLDGTTETGSYGERDAVDVRVRFREWPAVDFTKALQWDLDVSGLLSGEASVSGQRSAPTGTARVTSPAGRYYGVPYEALDVTSVLKGELSEVTAGAARVGAGSVRFHGSLGAGAVYDGVAEVRDVALDAVLPAPLPGVAWGGSVSGDVALQGTLARPRVKAQLRSAHVFFGDEGIGALQAEILGTGTGTLALTASCRSPRVDVTLTGDLGAAPPYASRLTLAARGTSLDPFLRAAYPALPLQAALVASGEIVIAGPLATPSEVNVDAAASSLELLLPEYPLRNVAPLRLRVASGRLELDDLRLAGEGTDLVLGGTAALVGPGALALTLKGGADLRALSLVTRQLRGLGTARVALGVTGSRAAPHVEGKLELDGAGLRVRGFPHGIEDVHGTVGFTEAAASFSALKGTLGGGPVELEGQVAYRTGRLESFDIHGTGRDLSLRYPEGLRSVLDAEVRLLGDGERQWVTGSVDVRSALWTRRYDVASELLAVGRGFEEPGAIGENVRYDVKIRAPGTLKIDNNLTTLQARADLSLQGTALVPVILGRAEVDRGRVYFQGNTYVIRRGTIDFANPQKIDPLFDIEAETRLRSYRVTLKVNGTLERVYPTLTSDPPLTAVQILNLLAGADEATVASLTVAQTDQARLAATGAASLAAGKISEEVGLEREAERLFGLNRFSIDPSVVKGGVANPTARLTVGRRITPDLNVLYSIDLRGTEERVLSVEYTLSDRLSLLMTRTQPGGFGFDIRLHQYR
jgi:translocation and assembly module TamB